MSAATSFALLSADLSHIVERVAPSVVTVRSGHAASSGTIVSPERVVMANHGLDPEADTVHVLLSDASHDARVIGRDPASDLALVAVEGVTTPPVAIAPGLPPVGSPLVSVGRAWNRTVAGFGIVHGHAGPVPRRRGGRLETILLTTITPYPGYSGGPLVNAGGEAVGIATAGIQRGVGAGLPMSAVLRVVESLSAHGRIRRGFIGVTSMRVDLPDSQRGPDGERSGLLVTSLAADGPAAKAGLLVGDVIVAVEGAAVLSTEDLMAFLAGDVIGRKVPAAIVRGTQSVALTLEIGERGVRTA
jgi:S1-C subfamily serine protease